MGYNRGMKFLREHILNLMRKSAYRPMDIRELSKHFDVARSERGDFAAVIEQLAESGEIVLIKGKRYGLPKKMNLVVGRLTVHPDGYGFVVPDEGGVDVFVKGRELNTAMHGDRVVVRVEHFKRGDRREERREGRVIRILERARQLVVGRFERYSTYGYLSPYDPRLISDIHIPLRESMDAETDQMAVAEIVSYASRNRTPEGRIVEVLGNPDDPGVDEAVVARHHNLPHRFSPEALEEAGRVAGEVAAGDIEKRVDLRGLFTVTIDGETAKDFDDAVSIELSEKKTFRLWVHIADVSHYVRKGSPLDRDAYERGTSVYFPGTVIPMLPERLSNGICSLNPGVDRLVFTVFMEFDRLGRLVRSDFLEAAIRSDARMTYRQVRDILEGKEAPPPGLPDDAPGTFRIMAELAGKLRTGRMKLGSIDFDLPEAEIVLDLRGRIQDIVRSERNEAHRIIEEFMLAANAAVASHVARLGLPFVYRVHQKPAEEKMEFFRQFVANFGYQIPEGEVTPLVLSELVRDLEGAKEERLLSNLLLRSMKQARYAVENVGHFGLAFRDYTHFTSPIRRYPDLTVHRLLRTLLKRGGYGAKFETELETSLPPLAEHCSERERVAMEAEREIVQLKKIRFMRERLGEEFDGFITGVTTFGFFVELCEYMVEGLIHVSSLGDDYYVFEVETQAMVGEHTRRTFRVGDEVRVKVENVSLERRQIDFGLVSSQPGVRIERPPTKKPGTGKTTRVKGKRRRKQPG